MGKDMKFSKIAIAMLIATAVPAVANASESAELVEVKQELKQIKEKLTEIDKAKASSISVNGAVRVNYAIKDYNENDKDRGGDIDLDVFRLELNGTVNDIIFSAQYRWHQYMDTIHHAYVGYQFDDNWQGKVGITRVPFGNLSFNSNNYFFSTNFYVGLEDDYDAGIKFIGNYDKHDIRIAFFKNDELGGIDGYVGDKTGRYSYDVVGTRDLNSEGIYGDPGQGLAEDSTLNLRYAYHFENFEVGASILAGSLEGENGDAGDHTAYAIHSKGNVGNFGFMFQYTNYEYDLDDGADFVTVGAYAFYDTIPAEADTYTLNLSYSVPVEIGPISDFTFYNDYSLMTNKSGDLNEDTVMNVSGVMATAGSLYVLFDYASGQNQPFLGGSLAGDSTETNHQFNVNVGFYF
jgi:hypothetical protein